MKYDPLKHHRRSIRLGGYDYAAPGAYFVTIVVQARECRLGQMAPEGVMRLSHMGQVTQAEWEALPRRFSRVRLDAYVLMPNHLHGLVVIAGVADEGKGEASANSAPVWIGRSRADASPLRAHGTEPGALGAMVQNLKSVCTRRVNALRQTPRASFWQRNYWEHVVRDEAELARIRAYIQANPAGWAADELHPDARHDDG